MKTIEYKKAVKIMANNTELFKDGIFGASSVLSAIYNKPKEQTADDLIEERRKMLNIEVPVRKSYPVKSGQGKGWKFESMRHSLASKGVKTGRKKRR